MTGMTLRFNMSILLVLIISLSGNAFAARNSDEEKPPRVYTERAKAMLDKLVADESIGDTVPFSRKELQDYKNELRLKDSFKYDPDSTLYEESKNIPVDMQNQHVVTIKLGHTFNTTVTFTDSLGNPWSFSLLSDISNKEVVSAKQAAPHILNVRPQKLDGKTNIAVILKGLTTPLNLVFDINNDEVYMNANLQVEGIGDSAASQIEKSKASYAQQGYVEPKLTHDPVKEQMLLFLTPEGYERRTLVDEYGEEVDYRDYVAWTRNDKLFIITKHDAFHPQPIDITSAPNGMNLLFEYDLVPVVTMEQGNKTVMLYIK